jgi:hypothetical protein
VHRRGGCANFLSNVSNSRQSVGSRAHNPDVQIVEEEKSC